MSLSTIDPGEAVFYGLSPPTWWETNFAPWWSPGAYIKMAVIYGSSSPKKNSYVIAAMVHPHGIFDFPMGPYRKWIGNGTWPSRKTGSFSQNFESSPRSSNWAPTASGSHPRLGGRSWAQWDGKMEGWWDFNGILMQCCWEWYIYKYIYICIMFFKWDVMEFWWDLNGFWWDFMGFHNQQWGF